MDRRAFFRTGLQKLADAALTGAEQAAASSATAWIRPPYALEELDFLLSCTRCNSCIEACPYDTVFRLPARLGVKVAGTPALDLVHKSCHLCPDWPCVKACPEGALKLPEEAPAGHLPELGWCRIESGTCLPYNGPECGACNGSCPVPGALLWEGTRPSIDVEKCVGCALCREACIHEPRAVSVHSRYVPLPGETADDTPDEKTTAETQRRREV